MKVDSDKANMLPPQCDILLFVTTDTEEEKIGEIAKELYFSIEESECVFGRYFNLGTIGCHRTLAVRTRLGVLRYEGAAWKVITYKVATGAMGIISTGMAFGTRPQEQSVGDILISTHIVPYDDRKKITRNGRIVTDYSRAKKRRAKESLLRLMQRFSEKDENKFKVHFGPLLSGAAQIQSSLYRDSLVKAFIKENVAVIGGDMEGAALLAASDPNDPSFIVIKGVSDFADEERDKTIEKGRPVACENAIRFFFGALLDDKH